jgi:transposase
LSYAQDHLGTIEKHIDQCEEAIQAHARHSEDAQRISAITGVGPITASAVVATVAHARDYKNGRQMAAWVGLVPRQHSSGGKSRLGRITKRGDTYLRSLLTQGARSALRSALNKELGTRTRLQRWIVSLHDRVGYHKTLVAIANKHARIIWAILAKGEKYDPDAWKQAKPA